MIVINFVGQPGAGKSTLAAGVFHELKLRRWNTELVTEYTKELILQDDTWTLGDELMVFAEKYSRIKRMANVDIVITDSPLINSAIYGRSQFGTVGEEFFKEVSGLFDNRYIVVTPETNYIPFGRMQDEEAARRAGSEILDLLPGLNSQIFYVPGNRQGVKTAVDIVEFITHQSGCKQF